MGNWLGRLSAVLGLMWLAGCRHAMTDVPAESKVTLAGPASIVAQDQSQFSVDFADAEGTTPSGRSVMWQTDNAAVATVDQTGLVTGIHGGTVTVAATIEGTTGTAGLRVVPTLAFCKPDPLVDTGCRLTDSPTDQTLPSVSGDRVVWADQRPEASGSVCLRDGPLRQLPSGYR
jgi:hypothetical protein